MDINELIKFILENRPVLTAFALLLWWMERNNRLSSERRERVLLRELASFPTEPESESVAEKVGMITTAMALSGLSILFLVGCGSVLTIEPPKTQIGAFSQATEVFSTPTQIATPTIKEVTPALEWIWETIGTYTPLIMSMNIRECSVVNDELCPVIGEVKLDESVQFYALVRHEATGDVWLCLDPEPSGDEILSQCREMVAYSLGGKEYGKLTFAEPAG